MNSSELILPFGLPPPELAKDLLRQMNTPALASILGQARIQVHAADPYARVLPHHAWLLGRMGEPARIGNVATSAMAALGLPAQQSNWFVLQPAHFHIARDHLVLTDPRQLPLDEAQSRALFESVAPLFGDVGMELIWGHARLWFLRADQLVGLETAAPDMAVGHNIDIWMPHGDGERDWRRIHNEVQMSWHAHPVNEAREMAGHKPVNALWCWNAVGGNAGSGSDSYLTRSGSDSYPKKDETVSDPIDPAVSDPIDHDPIDHPIDPESVSQALAAFLPLSQGVLEPAARGGKLPLQVLDTLSAVALAGDWGRWLQAMQEAELHCFAPALQALKGGQVSKLRLLIGDDRQLLQADCSRLGLNKFWRKPSLASLVVAREQPA